MNLQTFDKRTTSKDEWNRYMRTVLGGLGEVCQGLVMATYIRKHALKDSDYLIIGNVPGKQMRGKTTHLMGGFLIANESFFPGFLYIDVVCANQPGLGEMLLKEAEKHAHAKNLSGLVLSSLPHVVGYYRRLGYKNREDCNRENPDITDAFRRLAMPLIEKHKRRVDQYIDTAEGADYRRYLDYLREHNLAKNKKCRTVADCNIDGYIMVKCFRDEATGRTPRSKSPGRRAATPSAPSAARTRRSPRSPPSRPRSPARTRRSPRSARSPRSPPSAARTKTRRSGKNKFT